MTTHRKSFWPFRSLATKIISASVLVAAIGVLIGAAVRAQTVVLAGCVDPHIEKVAKRVYDTCHAKN
jgi:hypothetical protein